MRDANDTAITICNMEISTLLAYIRAIQSLFAPRKLLPIKNIKCFVILLFALSVSFK